MRRTDRGDQIAPELEEPTAAREVDRGVGVVAVWGVFGLVATKAVDVSTTIIGLGVSPTVGEQNPIAVAAIAQYGLIPGLLTVGVATVSVTVLLIEGGFRLAIGSTRCADESPVQAGRAVCYGVGCGCNLAIAAYNTVVIATVVFV